MAGFKIVGFKIVYTSCKLFLSTVYRRRVWGRENLPENGGYIIIANHQRLFDPAFIDFAVGKRVRYMAKAEIFKNPISAAFFRILGAFPVNRGKSDVSAVKTADNVLKNGEILGIFPEGTRSKTGELLKFKNGAALVAAQTGADILPIYIEYSNGVRPFSKVTLRILPVIKNEELSIRDGNSASLREATRRFREVIENAEKEARQ